MMTPEQEAERRMIECAHCGTLFDPGEMADVESIASMCDECWEDVGDDGK